MSARLTLARQGDLGRVLPMIQAFHAEAGIAAEDPAGAVTPLLEGAPHGAIWLIGPARAPVGYVFVSFGWSLEFGGLVGRIDEVYIRDGVRGRGMGTEALQALLAELARFGIRAVHLQVHRGNSAAERLSARLGFRAREACGVMFWVPAGTQGTPGA